MGDVLSTTFPTKLYVPFVVGVPLINPDPGVKASGGGNVPDCSEYVYPGVPPDATSESEYGVPIGAVVVAGQATVNSVANAAVTVTGPDIVTVVAADVELATGPVQPLNANPEFGVAETFCTDPAAKKLPLAGVTVPPDPATVVSWYCVSKFAV